MRSDEGRRRRREETIRRVRRALLEESWAERAVRRSRDFLAAGLGLVILSPLLLLIAIVIKLDSEGPVFYRQLRTGRDRRDRGSGHSGGRRTDDLGGAPFVMYKFRTMRNGAELDSGVQWAEAHDDRTTAVGRRLRGWKLDELPQLWNVLKGDMSLVGPRPERPAFVKSLRDTIPHYSLRHEVRPGITGWAQLHQSGDRSVEDVRTKLGYDLNYIQHRSLLLDAKILALTPLVLARGWLSTESGPEGETPAAPKDERPELTAVSATDAPESAAAARGGPRPSGGDGSTSPGGARSRRARSAVQSSFSTLAGLAVRQDAPVSCVVVGPTAAGRRVADVAAAPDDLQDFLRSHVRRADVHARIDDDELAIVAYDTRADGARRLVDRLRKLSERRVDPERENGGHALSAGIVELAPDDHGAGRREAVPSGTTGSSTTGLGFEEVLDAARAAYERARRDGGGVRIARRS